jgi:hypothetical protein
MLHQNLNLKIVIHLSGPYFDLFLIMFNVCT